jgi:hypothetical protein
LFKQLFERLSEHLFLWNCTLLQHRPGRLLRRWDFALRLVWWSDYLGRRHLQLAARYEPHHPYLEGSPDSPPVALIYPQVIQVARQLNTQTVLGFCACGAWGRLEQLAWMGPTCGPCFDRAPEDSFVPIRWTLGEQPLQAAALSSQGDLAVSVGDAVELWQTAPWQRRKRWGDHWVFHEVLHLEFSRSGNYLLARRLSDSLLSQINRPEQSRQELEESWDWLNNQLPRRLFRLAVEHPFINDLFWTVGINGVEAFSFTRRELPTLPYSNIPNIQQLAAAPTSVLLAALSPEGVHLWNLSSGENIGLVRFPVEEMPQGVVVAPHRKAFALLLHNEVRLWREGRYRDTLYFPGVQRVAFHPDGQRLAVWGNGRIRVFSAEDGLERHDLVGLGQWVFCSDGLTLLHIHGNTLSMLPTAAVWESVA